MIKEDKFSIHLWYEEGTSTSLVKYYLRNWNQLNQFNETLPHDKHWEEKGGDVVEEINNSFIEPSNFLKCSMPSTDSAQSPTANICLGALFMLRIFAP